MQPKKNRKIVEKIAYIDIKTRQRVDGERTGENDSRVKQNVINLRKLKIWFRKLFLLITKQRKEWNECSKWCLIYQMMDAWGEMKKEKDWVGREEWDGKGKKYIMIMVLCLPFYFMKGFSLKMEF